MGNPSCQSREAPRLLQPREPHCRGVKLRQVAWPPCVLSAIMEVAYVSLWYCPSGRCQERVPEFGPKRPPARCLEIHPVDSISSVCVKFLQEPRTGCPRNQGTGKRAVGGGNPDARRSRRTREGSIEGVAAAAEAISSASSSVKSCLF